MEYTQYYMEGLENIFYKVQNHEKLNGNMHAIVDKQGVLTDDNEDTN